MLPLRAWEQWQWIGTSYSPKLQHYWNLIIRLFSVVSGFSLEESYPSAEMQSARPPGHSLQGELLLLCRDVVGVFYSSNRLGHQDTRCGVVLPLCRDAVGVFYSPNRLGHHDIRCGGRGLTPLQRYSRCIMQPPLPADWTIQWARFACFIYGCCISDFRKKLLFD